MHNPGASLDARLTGWITVGETKVRHPHSAPGSDGIEKWIAARVQTAVGWLAIVQFRADAGMAVTPRLDLRLIAAGFKLECDALNRWRATYDGGFVTNWAASIPLLHDWLLATAQRPSLANCEEPHGPSAT